MTTIPQVSHALQAVLTTAATAAATQQGYTRRPDRAKLTPSTLVQTLVFGWLAHPTASLEQLAQTAAHLEVDITAQAIDQRFTFATAALLQEVLTVTMHHVIASAPVALPILQRFTEVCIHDSTTIVLPDALADHWAGCGGTTPTHTAAALKCGVQLDVLTGALRGLDLAAGRASDHRLPIQHTLPPAGALRLADLGFYDLQVFAAVNAAGGYWLSRVPANALVADAQHPLQPLLSFLTTHVTADHWEGAVEIGGGRLAARLLVQRVPQEVADQRRRRLRKDAKDKGRHPSAAALALTAWTILITNVPAPLLTLTEALVIARVRWQIELLFKLWKSQGHLARWRSAKAARILCEVYAKLIGMVIQQWIFQVGCWCYPERSLVKAAHVVRDHALLLASARMQGPRLIEGLETIQRILQHTARMNPRRKHPNTYQLLVTLTTLPEQA